MYLIQKITAAPLQQMTLVLLDGTTFTMTLCFMPLQQCWVIQTLTYQAFTVNGLKITVQPNMLYQWANVLPFGLGCFSTGNREPSLQQDFLSGAAKMYVLSEAEKDAYTEFIRGN